MIHGLSTVMSDVWQSDAIPLDLKSGFLMPIWKRKGNQLDCNSYRITLGIFQILQLLFVSEMKQQDRPSTRSKTMDGSSILFSRKKLHKGGSLFPYFTGSYIKADDA